MNCGKIVNFKNISKRNENKENAVSVAHSVLPIVIIPVFSRCQCSAAQLSSDGILAPKYESGTI